MGSIIDNGDDPAIANQGAEEILILLTPFFFMDAVELRKSLGVDNAMVGCSMAQAMECSETMRGLYDVLMVSSLRVLGREGQVNDPSVKMYACQVAMKMMERLWNSVNGGAPLGEGVEVFLIDTFSRYAAQFISHLAELTKSYCTGQPMPEDEFNVSRRSDFSAFVDCFDGEELRALYPLLESLGDAMAHDHAIIEWLWIMMPRLSRAALLEMARITQEYNLEWAMASVEVDD